MNDGLRVDHGGLETAAADLMTAVKNIDNRLTQLENELAPLRSDWTGQAQAAYTTAKGQWDQAMEDMRGILGSVGQAVSSSNDEYRSADQRGAASFGG